MLLRRFDEHAVRRRDGARLARQVRRRLGVARLRGDLRKIRQRQGKFGDRRHLARGRVVVLVVQAVRVHEMRVRAAELRRLAVHQLHKAHQAVAVFVVCGVVLPGCDVQPIDVFGERERRVVARGHHHQVQKLVDRELLSGLDLRERRACAFELLGDARRHRRARVHQVVHGFARHDIRHDLCERGHRQPLVRVHREHDRARIEAHHKDGFAVRLGQRFADEALLGLHRRGRRRRLRRAGRFCAGGFLGQRRGRQGRHRQKHHHHKGGKSKFSHCSFSTRHVILYTGFSGAGPEAPVHCTTISAF